MSGAPMSVQVSLGGKGFRTQVTLQNVALHIEAVHMEDRKLCGHRACVSPFERLLTKYAWACRLQQFGDLSAFRKDTCN